MKKILLVFLIFISIAGRTQEQDAWVYFKTKENTQLYLDNPLMMLSQRALDRRVAQNIGLDSKDIPISQNFVNQIDAAVGITVKAQSKWLNAVHVRGSVTAINSVSTLAFVDRIDFADRTLNTQNRKETKSLANQQDQKVMDVEANFSYGTSANQIQMLKGNLLHQQDYTGTGKIIAVLDGGFPGVNTTAPFQRLINNNLILGGYNFVDRNENFYTRNNHGTAVLSTMGGYVENQLVGTAPDASYYLFITEDTNGENPLEESLWVEAAERADSLGVDIINSSLGYDTFDNSAYNYSYEDMNGTVAFITRGADIAFSRGMICVISAGNEGNKPWHYITAPADGFNVLTIGAVTATRNYASFSSVGPSADGRVKPDVMAQGESAVVANLTGNVSVSNGTSFSSPIMAGMVACLWQALPNKTNTEIIQLIKESAHLYQNPTDLMGYGIPDFSVALGNALGVQESIQEKFTLYPNPVVDYVTVALPKTINNAKIRVFSIYGQQILEQDVTFQNSMISLGRIESGLYGYTIESDGKTQRGMLIKK
ncbi:S8 family serine peptidase [Flavobacterium sp. '19STA2R22 D10 B1']|uniref:S8 family serine peptidase n=1 Tax=Flavobacterium aerium TaxID=3037261 RepID=UPI00278C2957|nr:S8 family serine peptidase [Flavobacterium sp. '19STA2R22 D10 B1']